MVRLEIGGQADKWTSRSGQYQHWRMRGRQWCIHTVLRSCSQAIVINVGLLSTVKRFPSKECMSGVGGRKGREHTQVDHVNGQAWDVLADGESIFEVE